MLVYHVIFSVLFLCFCTIAYSFYTATLDKMD